MLKPYHIHNENFEITHAQVFEEGTQPENAVYIEYCDFIKPMVNPATKAVYEGATFEEISEFKSPEYLTKLQLYSSDLRVRAKAAAIGKKGERDYIFAQVEMYELKYKIANDEIVGQYFTDLLSNEAVEFGTTIGVNLDLATFKELIINRYETAEAQYHQFLFMIERCRTFIQTLIETNQFDKVDSAFAMIDTLNDVSQATTLMANILNL